MARPSSPPPAAEIASCQEAAGGIRVFRMARHVIVNRVEGHLSEAMAHAWIQAVDPMFAIGSLDALADWEDMTGYEANARRVLTSWALRRRTQTAYACFLVKPGIVSMGVTVAVMTMSIAGMDVHSTTSRTAFREAMRQRVSANQPPH